MAGHNTPRTKQSTLIAIALVIIFAADTLWRALPRVYIAGKDPPVQAIQIQGRWEAVRLSLGLSSLPRDIVSATSLADSVPATYHFERVPTRFNPRGAHPTPSYHHYPLYFASEKSRLISPSKTLQNIAIEFRTVAEKDKEASRLRQQQQ